MVRLEGREVAKILGSRDTPALTCVKGLASDTVFLYSIPSQEIHMRHDHLRYTYSPSPVILPRWVRRVWSWF